MSANFSVVVESSEKLASVLGDSKIFGGLSPEVQADLRAWESLLAKVIAWDKMRHLPAKSERSAEAKRVFPEGRKLFVEMVESIKARPNAKDDDKRAKIVNLASVCLDVLSSAAYDAIAPDAPSSGDDMADILLG